MRVEVVAFAISALVNLVSGAAIEYYISPEGNDGSSGTSPEHPWASPGRAQQAIYFLKSSNGGVLPGPVNVNFLGGVYPLAQPMNITQADSGDESNTVSYIGPASGSKAVLSAGAVVAGWQVNANYSDVFQTTLPSDVFTQQTPTMIAASTNQTLVVAQPGQITSDPAALTNAFVMIWHCWISSISRIASWDPATGHLVPVGESGDPFFGASGNRYALQNVADLSILAAGQFLFNPTTRVLTYRALPGEDPTNPANITFIAERFSNAVYLSGTSSAPVTNVAFVNLTLSHTAPLLEESCISSGCGDQSDANDPYAALYATYASNITISGVEVAGSGSYGMIFDVGCHDVLVSQCWLHSLGEGGIKVGTGNGGAAANVSSVVHQLTVTDSVIEDSGYIVEAGAGVIVQQAYNVTVAHNHIHHLKYTGVSTGWSWGYAPTSNGNITVAFNLIHDIGMGILSDMGCVYNLGVSPGTTITNNICHDVVSYGYGGWGLYTDEGSSWVTIDHNIVYHTKSAGIHQHYGENNTFWNNVIAFPTITTEGCPPSEGCDFAAVRSSQHGPGGGAGVNSSFAFFNNIVLLDDANSTLFYSTVDYGFKNMTMDKNIYWSTALSSPTSQLQFPPTQAPTTFPQWQAGSKDGHSLIADPQFVDPLALDFSHLEPTSPALALGFQPIDTSQVGPRPFR